MKTRCKELRLEKKISQIHLATKLEISQSTISKIEKENIIPNSEILLKYADYFHVTVDYILLRSNEKIGADELLRINPNFSHMQTLKNTCQHLSKNQLHKLCDFLETLN